MNVGTKISKARNDADLSIRALALAVECSPGHLSRVESGETTPSEDLLRRIATRLKIEPDSLLMSIGVLPQGVVRWLLKNPEEVKRILKRARG